MAAGGKPGLGQHCGLPCRCQDWPPERHRANRLSRCARMRHLHARELGPTGKIPPDSASYLLFPGRYFCLSKPPNPLVTVSTALVLRPPVSIGRLIAPLAILFTAPEAAFWTGSLMAFNTSSSSSP